MQESAKAEIIILWYDIFKKYNKAEHAFYYRDIIDTLIGYILPQTI